MEKFLWSMLRIPSHLMVLLFVVAIRDTGDICGEEFGLSALVMVAGEQGTVYTLRCCGPRIAA